GTATCDIGAYESGLLPTATPTFTPTFTPTSTFTPTPKSLVVTTLADSNDGACALICSLRDAIAASWNGDTITFGINVRGTVTLSSQLTVSNSITITGPGANVLTISGNNANRVFYVASTGNLTMSGLTIANGNSNNSPLYSGNAGGMANDGIATVSNSI